MNKLFFFQIYIDPIWLRLSIFFFLLLQSENKTIQKINVIVSCCFKQIKPPLPLFYFFCSIRCRNLLHNLVTPLIIYLLPYQHHQLKGQTRKQFPWEEVRTLTSVDTNQRDVKTGAFIAYIAFYNYFFLFCMEIAVTVKF